jgi:hypothetical protein
LIIVERKNRAAINKEHDFQMAGEVSDEQILSIVEKDGATTVISCTVSGSGKLKRLRIRALDVLTGKVQSYTSYDIGDTQNFKSNIYTFSAGEYILSSWAGFSDINGTAKFIFRTGNSGICLIEKKGETKNMTSEYNMIGNYYIMEGEGAQFSEIGQNIYGKYFVDENILRIEAESDGKNQSTEYILTGEGIFENDTERWVLIKQMN